MRYDRGLTVAADTWTTIVWNTLQMNRNLQYNNISGTISFPFTGIYQTTIVFQDSDSNTNGAAFRIHGVLNGITKGISTQFVVDEGSADYTSYSLTFLSNIDDLTDGYGIQFARQTNSFTFDDDWGTIGGVEVPYMYAIISYLGTQN